MSSGAGQLDPRIRRTLQFIYDAIIALMDEKGFGHTTVRDITERAGINRATFYLHFQDKHDLLDRIVDERMEQFEAAFSLPPDFKADDFIRNAESPPASFIRQFEHIAEHARFYKVMLGPNGLPGFARRMEQAIRESLYHRSVIAQPYDNHLQIPRELVIRYTTSAHLGIILYWLEQGMSYSPAYMAGQLIRLHVLGTDVLFREQR